MVRRSGNSRVSGGGPSQPVGRPVSDQIPSLRQRKPFMFWTVVVAVGAMVLTTGASFITAFL